MISYFFKNDDQIILIKTSESLVMHTDRHIKRTDGRRQTNR